MNLSSAIRPAAAPTTKLGFNTGWLMIQVEDSSADHDADPAPTPAWLRQNHDQGQDDGDDGRGAQPAHSPR